MATMDAVRYHGANIPFTLEKISVPTVSEGCVLVEVKAAALCHTELHFLDGTLNLGVPNITMGHEAVGIIVSVGEGVDCSRLQNRVIVYYYVGCGTCRHCIKGNEQLCNCLKSEFGFITDGGLAKYICVPSRNAVILPDNIPFELAAPIGCGVTTAVHASKLASIKPNEWVVIFGTNGIGFNIIQLAKHYGAKVIAICRSESKRLKAIELGADETVDASDINSVASKVRELTSGEGADVIFECVGSRSTMDQCVGWGGALGKRGRLILLGYHAGSEHDFRVHPIPLLVYEQQVIGSVGATLDDLIESVSLVEKQIVVPVVACCLPISEFQTGLDLIKNCNCVGKIVINHFGS